MRRSEQRRVAVFALYQHDLTGRELGETLGRSASLFARALAHAAADRAEELDAVIDRHAHGWAVERIQPLERSILRVALIEILHPDAAPADREIPPEGAIEEAVESAKVFCGAQAPAFINGVLAAVLREVREFIDPMSDSEQSPEIDRPEVERPQAEGTERDRSTADALEGLIGRLESAAEQLRSGELSTDAAATLVEECAVLANRAGAELERRVHAPPRGQGSLL